jgi:hypothetical protein
MERESSGCGDRGKARYRTPPEELQGFVDGVVANKECWNKIVSPVGEWQLAVWPRALLRRNLFNSYFY